MTRGEPAPNLPANRVGGSSARHVLLSFPASEPPEPPLFFRVVIEGGRTGAVGELGKVTQFPRFGGFGSGKLKSLNGLAEPPTGSLPGSLRPAPVRLRYSTNWRT